MSSRSQLNKVMFDTNVTVLFVFLVQYMLKFFQNVGDVGVCCCFEVA